MLKRILGLLGWLGVALVLSAVAIRFLKPQWQPYYTGLAIGGLVCTLLYILSQWREIGQSFAGRQARYGSLAAASVIVVLAILVAINYLGTRHDKRWDLTGGRQFSLSDQTKKVLHDLNTPVHATVFDKTDDFQRFRDRLDEYTYQTKLLTVDYVDMDKQPAVAQRAGITSYGTIVFDYKGRSEKATTDSEQDLTNALIKAIEGRQPKVYFTEGHGERDTTSAENGGYNGANSALTSNNFLADKVALAQKGSVPADADILIIAGPKTDFLPSEIDMLKAYLAKGGKLLMMLDPVIRPDQSQLTALQGLAHDWGVDVGTDIVVDVSGIGQMVGGSEAVPIAINYPSHPITENFKLMTAFPLARSVDPVQSGVNGHTAQAIVQTSPSSWAETDIKDLAANKPVKFDQGQDKKGPISLAAAVSAPAANAPAPAAGKAADAAKPETRIVVFGDSDFASNGWLGTQGNRDLFLNTLNWLAQQENLISIRPREAEDRRITLTQDQEQRIFYLAVLIVPGLILLAGVQTWWRRR
jgi:ABC-type uncharacterized transport system involved in gliding motility auxiliary subunit